MWTEPYFQIVFWLLRRIIKSTFCFILFFSFFYVLEYCSSVLVFLQRKASSHFKIICSLWLFVFFECLVFSEEEIGVDFDFIFEMKFIFLFYILSECLFVGLKVSIEKILFSKGLSFDFLFVFEDLIDRGGLGVRSLIKFVHKKYCYSYNTILKVLSCKYFTFIFILFKPIIIRVL